MRKQNDNALWREWWRQQAHQQAFPREGAPEQSMREVALYSYHDASRSLHFLWTGDVNVPVQITAHGMVGVFHFNYLDHRPNWVVAGTHTAALSFKEACTNWIEAKEDAA